MDEFGLAEVGPREIDPSELGLVEPGLAEVGSTEIDPNEVDLIEFGIAEIGEFSLCTFARKPRLMLRDYLRLIGFRYLRSVRKLTRPC